jgi:hypothetical protein
MPNTQCTDGGDCTCHDGEHLCSACIRLHCRLNKDRKPFVIEDEVLKK